MSDEPSVSCPRCGGKGSVSAERIQELLSLGHPVTGWKPGNCDYCGGAKHVPSIVAELVPLHDNNATPSRAPFASQAEFLKVLDRLEHATYSAYRDDAWASAACLLLATDFDRGDLPAALWRRAQPFLFGNSLGRLLAAEVALGLFSVPEAIEKAFMRELPRAADMPIRSLDERAPLWLLNHADLWLGPQQGREVIPLFERHLSILENAVARIAISTHLLRTVAQTCGTYVLLNGDAWYSVLASLPCSVRAEGSLCHPRIFVIESLCDQVLPTLPRGSVGAVVARLVQASEKDSCFDFAAQISKALLRVVASFHDDALVEEVFKLLLNRVRADGSEQFTHHAGLLAQSLASAGAASESRFLAIIDGIAGTGREDCWSESQEHLWVALGTAGDQPWSWSLFQYAVSQICSSPRESVRYWGIRYLSEGLAVASPPWAGRALEALMQASESFNTSQSSRAELYREQSKLLFQLWKEPLFHSLYEKLLSASAKLSSQTDQAFCWLGSLNFPLRKDAQPAYQSVVVSLLDTALATIRTLPASAQVAAALHLPLVFGWQMSNDACELLFPTFVEFVDALPSGDATRTKVWARAVEYVCSQDRAFDLKGISNVARRLGDWEAGANKYKAIADCLAACCLESRHRRRSELDTSENVLAVVTALVAAEGMAEYSSVDEEGTGITGGTLTAAFARVFSEYKSPLPGIKVTEYERMFAAARRLSTSVFTRKDSEGRTKNRYVPRYLAQSALLRRLGPIGDDSWRLAFIDDVLTDLRAQGTNDHARQLVHAILEALGSVEPGEWQKQALEKVLTFLAREREVDGSLLRRAVVTQLVRTGDLPKATRVAREMTSPTLRSEALAEVAVAMAASLPREAIALMQEIVAPEMRTQVAVKLSASLPLHAELGWILLETAASDPVRLQEIVAQLLTRDSTVDIHDLIAILGWSPPGAKDVAGVAAVLDELVAAECITGKKRDRILDGLSPDEQAKIEASARAAVVAQLVRLGLVTADEAADFEPRRQ
jgi:hypothetical protein